MANRYWTGGTGTWSDTSHWASTDTGTDPLSPAIADSYSEANRNSQITHISGSYIRSGESFAGNGGVLNIVKFSLIASGTPAGNCWAEIYAHTGTFGTNGVPTGSPLATSDTVVASSVSGSFSLKAFTFSGANRITLANGTKYFAVFYYSCTDTNYIANGLDTTSPTASGNSATSTGGAWTASSNDICFYVYTDGITTGASIPVSVDSVFITSLSGFSGGGTITVDTNVSIANLTSNQIGHTYSLVMNDNIIFSIGNTPLLKGTSGKYITISSSNGHTLSVPSGYINCDYLNLSHSNATGGANWYAGNNSINSGGNTGWIFTSAPFGDFTVDNSAITYSDTLKKRYYYKVYSQSGTYITTWSTDVITLPEFRTVLNGGAGELSIVLARKYDNFGEGLDVNLLNKVELWIGDNQISSNYQKYLYDIAFWDSAIWDEPTQSFRKIYTGYISSYSPVIDDESQYVNVTLLGYGTETSYKVVKDQSGNTQFTLTSKDSADALKTIINYYRADGNYNLDYSATSIQSVGNSITYTFNEMTLQEALDKIIEMTPYNYYWFIDSNGKVNLKQISTTPDHYITIGNDISYLESNKRAENLANVIYLIGGGSPNLYNKYSRSSSIATYGKFERKIQENNVTDNTTADAIAKRYLDTYQTPETRAIIRIADNNGLDTNKGQDIESYQVGDTLQIKNINYGAKGITLWDRTLYDVDVWDNTMQYVLSSSLIILSISYYMTHIEIEVSSRLPELTKRVEQVSKILDQQIQEGIPVTPTVRSV